MATATPLAAVPQPVSAGAPEFVACPTAGVARAATAPARPDAPQHDEGDLEVGGEGLATEGLTVPEGAPPVPGKKLSATTWLVADLDSGAVLGACGPHEYGTPASVQKLLLAATALGRLDADEKVKITADDLKIERGSSAVGLLVGGTYTVSDLWMGLILNSGNDAANAIARLAGGDGGVPATIAEMNATADNLGALQTHAVTPSGLDGDGQFTSVYDLALITRACYAIKDCQRYTAAERHNMPAQSSPKAKGFQIQNGNKLLFNYDGAFGAKTGFTVLARHTYVGAAARDGRRLVVAILGAENRPISPWQQGAALLDWGFSLPADASVGRLVEPGELRAAEAAAAAEKDDLATEVLPGVGGAAAAQELDGLSLTTAIGLVLVVLAVPAVMIWAALRGRRGRRRATF